MRMAEEFDRCKKCGGGWFKATEKILIQKGSRPDRKPMVFKKLLEYSCEICNHIQYAHEEEDTE